MNIVLIGFSGTGKSSVGEALADRLGWEFVDTDAEVERATGKRIHQIFAEQGESAFRCLESEMVGRALRGSPRVVAVGGGAVLDPLNRKVMSEGSLVVLLDAGVETIHERLCTDVADEPRPLLASADPRARIGALKAARDAIYREAAHLVVSTDGVGVDVVAERVAAAVMDRSPLPLGEGQGEGRMDP